MFANGATPDKVKTWCYDEDEEDFTKGKVLNAFYVCSFDNRLQTLLPLMFGHWNILKHFLEIRR